MKLRGTKTRLRHVKKGSLAVSELNATTMTAKTAIAEGWLRTNFPVFNANLPLRVGIYDMILIVPPPKHVYPSAIKNFLKQYTTTKEYYQSCLTPGAVRYDLNGNIHSPVTKDEQDWAAACLAALPEESDDTPESDEPEDEDEPNDEIA